MRKLRIRAGKTLAPEHTASKEHILNSYSACPAREGLWSVLMRKDETGIRDGAIGLEETCRRAAQLSSCFPEGGLRPKGAV